MSIGFKKLQSLPQGIDNLAKLAQAEGFNFIQRLIDEYTSGENTFSAEGEVLLGVYDATSYLIAIGGLNRDLFMTDVQTKLSVGRLRRVYVHPSYRYNGVGRGLVLRLKQAALPYFSRLRLFTANEQAARFYEALGYQALQGWRVSHVKELITLS